MGIPSPAWAARAPRALAVLLALLTLGLVAAPSPAAADPGEHKVVFIGAPGLAWSDVSPEATPAIWAALGDSVGSLAVRSVRRVACPLDGWLALNTSARAAGPSARCDVLVDPIDSILPVWPQVEEALAEQNYAASPGLLARNLAAAGASAVAIGPGAGVALANENGRVPRYEARRTPGEGLASQVARAVEAHDLTIIDAGPLRPAPKGAYSTPGQFRADHLRIINNRIEAVFRGVEAAAATPTVILAGLADDDAAATRLFAITGPGVPRGTLTSPSTRQEGYTLATDLQATVLAALGVEDRSQGAAAYTIESDASVSELAAAELDRERRARALQPPIIPTFFFILVVANVALYAAVAIGLRRPNVSRFTAWLARRVGASPPQGEAWLPARTNVLRAMRGVALGVAALPLASYLANIVPWWRFSAPGLALAAAVAAMIAAVVALALARPWRHLPLGPGTVIAGLLAAVLAIDVARGSPLQLGAVMGNPPVVAGRWYGMNNTAFAQFSASMILLAVAAAQPLVRRGRRVAAAWLIAAFGLLTAFIDGAPFLGADFGGPPSILPAFLILALLAAGVRITARRVGLLFLGTAVVVAAIAFLDWLRPPASRTHIGNFLQQVLDGEVLTVVWRKLDANLRVLMGNRPLTILALSGVALVVFVLARPIRSELTEPRGGRFAWLSGGTPINAMTKQSPLLGAGLVAAGILAGLGMAVNDSGIAIPANVAAIVVPILIAATAAWMLRLEPAAPSPPPPSGSP